MTIQPPPCASLTSSSSSSSSSSAAAAAAAAAAAVASGSCSSGVCKAARPKSVSQWSLADVQKWLRRSGIEYYHLYSEAFLEQDITGRSLVRLNENSLLRLGVVHPDHRQAILRLVAKLRQRSSIVLLKDMESNRR